MTAGTLTATAVGVTIDEQVLLPTTSATIGAGRALAIRGPNGSGKTTLLRVLSGLATPSTGEVHWEGEPLRIRRADHRAAVAAMIGMPPLARDLTLLEQLRFVRATWGDSAADGERAALDGLAELEISPLAARYPTELSSGQLQLFSLALTFARPCRVLLLDEPEQRLDAHRRGLVADALRRRIAAGGAVGLATHSGKLARAIGADVLTVGGEAP
ncbi:ATP-binding cassette domain-containing protein [Microbacterium sp. M28]|uniref:ABC transporter ATP-binding protein n=1 Tax=Microbacterium sp. M28 TaxID=2962064 RepID=UPI0021F3D95D|nr:ATP-binding cassette domain-containing protein [Microbacterium sp. M28]UYO97335.1 ATP-binding cassette domain-containing protein [Microbacterium sp. M28]